MIDKLINELQKIAKKNGNHFRYAIEILPMSDGIRYSFEAIEKADGHTFVFGVAKSIDGAAEEAFKYLDETCEEWGYKR